jgi:hypothetical protein
MAAHQPDGDDTCTGCGRIWERCAVVVAARRYGLADHLAAVTAGPGSAPGAARTHGVVATTPTRQ